MSLSGAEVLISEGVSRADGKVVEGMGAERRWEKRLVMKERMKGQKEKWE